MQDTVRGVDIWLYQLRIVDDDLLRSCDDLEVVSLDRRDCMRSEYRISVGKWRKNLRFTPGSNDSDQMTFLCSTACQLRILSRSSVANSLSR